MRRAYALQDPGRRHTGATDPGATRGAGEDHKLSLKQSLNFVFNVSNYNSFRSSLNPETTESSIMLDINEIANDTSHPALIRMIAKDIAESTYFSIGDTLLNLSPLDIQFLIFINGSMGRDVVEAQVAKRAGNKDVKVKGSLFGDLFLTTVAMMAQGEGLDIESDETLMKEYVCTFGSFLTLASLYRMGAVRVKNPKLLSLSRDFLSIDHSQVVGVDGEEDAKGDTVMKLIWKCLKAISASEAPAAEDVKSLEELGVEMAVYTPEGIFGTGRNFEAVKEMERIMQGFKSPSTTDTVSPDTKVETKDNIQALVDRLNILRGNLNN